MLRLWGLEWTRDETCCHFFITGATGTGKTARAVVPIVHGLRSTLPETGVLAVDSKGALWKPLAAMAAKLGQEKSLRLIRVRPTHVMPANWTPPLRLNLLGDPSVPWSTYAKIIVDTATAAGQRGGQAFFKETARDVITHAMHALEAADLPVTLANVHDAICISTQTALLLARLGEKPGPEAEVERQYFKDFAEQPPEQKSGTVYTVANFLRPYTPPDIREVVCSVIPNFTLAEVDAGRLICLSVPQKQSLAAWIKPGAEVISLTRKEVWNHGDLTAEKPKPLPAKFGKGRPPPELGRENLKHTEMETISVVRKALWDQAKWRGVAFFLGAEMEQPPILALAFLEREAPGKIFAGWEKEVGRRDVREKIRITIVRGFKRSRPNWYRVMISPNLESDPTATKPRYVFLSGRKLVMEATTSVNLDNFLRHFKKFGGYFLCRASLKNLSTPPELVREPAIVKTQLIVRDAWEIGPDDPDFTALEPSDDPVIPEGESSPPVKAALERLREMDKPGGE